MMPGRRRFQSTTIWQLALACYWCALFVGTHLPKALPIASASSIDKLLHVVAFGVLAMLLAATWRTAAGELTGGHLRWVWIVVVMYGALDEWTQGFVGRHVSAGDWLADALGALIGLLLFAWLTKRSARERS